jgi:uncharacterized membrane protein
MRSKNLDLIIVMVFVVVNVIWLEVPKDPAWPGVVSLLPGLFFALPLTFFLSGYALVQTLFRRRTPEADSRDLIRRPDLLLGHPVGRADQILLSFGLSMAIDVLVGFGLNILPIGLQSVSWILSLGLITVVCTIVALFLRRGDLPSTRTGLPIRIKWQDVVLSLLALFVLASAVWLAIIRPLNPQPSFTQFWILPANQASKTCAVSLGVQSFETTSETYRVIMNMNNAQINAWPSIVLSPQQKWTQSIPIHPGDNNAITIEALLYRNDNPGTPYRQVHLTYYIASTNNNGTVQQQCLLNTSK